MAKTKKKRKTKHRGNALGMVESRGRTGRKPTSSEKVAKGKKTTPEAGAARPNRLDNPPTWRNAFVRAVFASIAFFGILVLLLKRPMAASGMVAVAMVGFYTPLGYFTDSWIFRRRMKRKADSA
ncbi:MAG: hypothetical protein F2799_00195 [Actinobacteria bacterium]|uniref:Unannotated protein n=1 Tax=freshwater metagenome TaxID=449393 RepID=A0A6J7CL59_9ZZZZ|nr:hypothetical protein [Actinomycetota bacterium]